MLTFLLVADERSLIAHVSGPRDDEADRVGDVMRLQSLEMTESAADCSRIPAGWGCQLRRTDNPGLRPRDKA